MADYTLHHALVPEQLRYADVVTVVKAVGYYHGGDPIYTLVDGGPSAWLEPCLEGVERSGTR
jgi:hypothetical protein